MPWVSRRGFGTTIWRTLTDAAARESLAYPTESSGVTGAEDVLVVALNDRSPQTPIAIFSGYLL